MKKHYVYKINELIALFEYESDAKSYVAYKNSFVGWPLFRYETK